MIGKLKGKIDSKKTSSVILDVNGVGYLVYIPLSTFDKLHASDAELFIHTYVKEDMIKLFGFYSESEKDFFEELIKINGIGPSLALSLISGIGIEDLCRAVDSSNTSALVKIPGIGKSKAEKIIFELKRKINKLSNIKKDNSDAVASVVEEASEALVSLGFDEEKTRNIVKSVYDEDETLSIEDLIKRSLKKINS